MGDGEDRLWESFWQAAPRHGCTASFPPAVVEQIEQRWRHSFGSRRAGTLLDLATGRGAVIEHAIAAGVSPTRIIGIDRVATPDTIAGVTMLDEVDAAALPFAAGSFDMVASQFGIEYAGWHAALAEAMRVAHLSLLVLAHHRDSAVVRHGREQARQAERMATGDALAEAIRAAAAGDDRAAPRQLIDALRPGAENYTLLDQMAETCDAILAIGRVAPAAEIGAMIGHLDAELHRHAGRMRAMADAAITDADLRDGTLLLERAGFAVATERVISESGELVAVWIVAERSNTRRKAA